MHDRVPPARPHEELHLIPPPIEKDEDVPAEWVLRQDGANLVRQSLERLSQIDGDRREIDAHGAGNHEHVPRSNSNITLASHAGETAAADEISKAMISAKRSTIGMLGLAADADEAFTIAGTNLVVGARARLTVVVSTPRRFVHQ
jgi:hypothetical protein